MTNEIIKQVLCYLLCRFYGTKNRKKFFQHSHIGFQQIIDNNIKSIVKAKTLSFRN